MRSCARSLRKIGMKHDPGLAFAYLHARRSRRRSAHLGRQHRSVVGRARLPDGAGELRSRAQREQHRHQRGHQRRALPQGQARRRGTAVSAGVVRLCRQGAAGPQGHALFLRHHPALRRAGLHQGDRARHQAARAEGHLHPFQPQGALSRRRRGAAVLGAGSGPRRTGDDPPAASRLRRGADEGLSPRLQHRAAVRFVSGARPHDRARRARGFPEAEDRRLARRRRHLRNHQPDGLRLRTAGRGVLPRLLRADEDQARAEPLSEKDVSRHRLLQQAGGEDGAGLDGAGARALRQRRAAAHVPQPTRTKSSGATRAGCSS